MQNRRRKDSPFKAWKKRQAYRLIPLFPPLASFFIRGLTSSLRIRFTGHPGVFEMIEQKRPFVMVCFHGRQFLLVHHWGNWPVVAMTSISYMGEIQSRVLKGFGFETIPGSRSKGGAKVLGQMVRLVRSGKVGAFAVDGPRGPYREVKPGAVYVARKLGVPVVPVSTSAYPSTVMENLWDRYLLPAPFAKAVVHYGEPLYLDGTMNDEAVERDCSNIRQILARLEQEADEITGRIKV